MHGPEYGAQLESVSVYGGSHVSDKSHSRPRSIVSVRERSHKEDFRDHEDRMSHVSSHSKRSHLAPSDTGSRRSRSERRYVVDAPPLLSHATAPVIVVSEEDHHHTDFHSPSIAPSHRSSRSRSQVSEARTVRIHEPAHDDHVPSDSERSHKSSNKHRAPSHSHRRSHSSSEESDADSKLTKKNLAVLSRSSSPERQDLHAKSHAKSHRSHHSRSGSDAGLAHVVEGVLVERELLKDTANRAPSQTSHDSAHSRHHSHADESPLEKVRSARPHSVIHSKAPSRTASHCSAHHSHVSRAQSAHRNHDRKDYESQSAPNSEPGSESDNDSIYPESSISQRSERSHLSHVQSHHSHHSHHSRHLTPSHVSSRHSVHSHHAARHAPSFAPSHHSSHSHHSIAKALSEAPGHHGHELALIAAKAPSVTGSHHSSHSRHSNVSAASTLKGSRHDAEDWDHRNHTSSRTLRSSHSHHSHHVKLEPSESPPIAKLQQMVLSREQHPECGSDDEFLEHGGSVALLHQRQKHKRQVSRGRMDDLAPLELRPECNGEGFRPHRSKSRRSRSRHSRSHSKHRLEKGIVEVTENRLVRAPTVRELKREREREADHGWFHSKQKVVEVKRERNGAKLYKIV